MVGRSNGRFPLGSVEELCMEELCCGRIVRGRIVRGRIVLWKNCAWKNCVWKNCAWKNCGTPIIFFNLIILLALNQRRYIKTWIKLKIKVSIK
jgi:hypothetical protein